ncbi:amidohydrolase family protein [Streptomyces sp. NPDC002454]
MSTLSPSSNSARSLPEPSEGPATRTLLRGGRIVSMDPAVGDLVGDLLIEDGRIAAVGTDLEIAEGSAEVIDASRHILVPGFIDSHRHLYQSLLRGMATDWSLSQYFTTMFSVLGPNMEPEHLALGTSLGAYDALDSGVTAVYDYSHNQTSPDHTDEAVRALLDSGIRSVFGYGGTLAQHLELLSPPFKSTPSNEAEIRRVRSQYFSSDSGLVTMGFAVRGPDNATMDVVRADLALGRELGLRINTHIGMGVLDIADRPHVTRLHKEGLLGDDLIFGHCNFLTEEEFRLMADAGVSASVTPEDEAGMGHGWPPIVQLLRAGIRPNIGIDTCMAVGGDPFTAMRFALAVPRGLANQRSMEEDSVNPWQLNVSARDVLEFATIEGARALGMESVTGSLTPGKQADIVMIRTDHISMAPVLDPVASIVHHASRQTVDTVFVAGKAVKRDGELLGVDIADLTGRAADAAAALLEKAGISPGWAPMPPEGDH